MLQRELQRMLQRMLQHRVLQRMLQRTLQHMLQHTLQHRVLQHALQPVTLNILFWPFLSQIEALFKKYQILEKVSIQTNFRYTDYTGSPA